jgi:transcription antitermination factor NusG
MASQGEINQILTREIDGEFENNREETVDFTVGDRVIVIAGPAAGYVGIVAQTRRTVRVGVSGGVHPVTLDRASLARES